MLTLHGTSILLKEHQRDKSRMKIYFSNSSKKNPHPAAFFLHKKVQRQPTICFRFFQLSKEVALSVMQFPVVSIRGRQSSVILKL